MGYKVTYKTILDGIQTEPSSVEALVAVKIQATLELLYQSIDFHTEQVEMK